MLTVLTLNWCCASALDKHTSTIIMARPLRTVLINVCLNVSAMFDISGVRMSSLTTVLEESRQSQSTITSLVERIKRQKGSDPTEALVLTDTPWSPKKQSETITQSESANSSSSKCGLKNYGFTIGREDTSSSHGSNIDKTVSSAAVGDTHVNLTLESNPSCFDTNDSCVSSDTNCQSLGLSSTSGNLNLMTSGEPTSFAHLECPVCGVTKKLWDLNEFNQHIDICLNQETVRDILTNKKKPSTPNRLVRKALLDIKLYDPFAGMTSLLCPLIRMT